MAYRVRHSPSARLGLVELWGTVTRDQLVACLEHLYDPSAWDPTFDALWDGRRLSRLLLLPEDIAAVAAVRNRMRTRRPTSRVAIVVTRDLDAEIGTLLLRFREPERTRGAVFRDLDAALNYLGREALPPGESFSTTGEEA